MNISKDLISSVKGFLDEDEGRCLYEMALKACSLGPCLEIGSYCGRSTLYLAAACKEKRGILFSIDHHQGSEEQQPGEEFFDPELFECSRQLLMDASTTHNTRCIDLVELLSYREFKDSLHYNSRGHEKIAVALAPEVYEMLGRGTEAD